MTANLRTAAVADRSGRADATEGAMMLLWVNQSGGITAQSVHANTINVLSGPRGDHAALRQHVLAEAKKIHEAHTTIIAAGTGTVRVIDGYH